jgi:hypothetical protein
MSVQESTALPYVNIVQSPLEMKYFLLMDNGNKYDTTDTSQVDNPSFEHLHAKRSANPNHREEY